MRKLIWIVVFVAAFFLGKFLWSAMGAESLTGEVRKAFVESAFRTCFARQKSAPENASLSQDTIAAYCNCYTAGLADLISLAELRSYPKDGSITPSLQAKIDVAANACLKSVSETYRQ
jgi:hypothetical protein